MAPRGEPATEGARRTVSVGRSLWRRRAADRDSRLGSTDARRMLLSSGSRGPGSVPEERVGPDEGGDPREDEQDREGRIDQAGHHSGTSVRVVRDHGDDSHVFVPRGVGRAGIDIVRPRLQRDDPGPRRRPGGRCPRGVVGAQLDRCDSHVVGGGSHDRDVGRLEDRVVGRGEDCDLGRHIIVRAPDDHRLRRGVDQSQGIEDLQRHPVGSPVLEDMLPGQGGRPCGVPEAVAFPIPPRLEGRARIRIGGGRRIEEDRGVRDGRQRGIGEPGRRS